jgi:response regulator of citrate/malate metabolism
MSIIHLNPGFNNDEDREEKFLEHLRSLEKKSRRKKKQETLQEKVLKWYSDLKTAQERGYTYEEIAELIAEKQGIQISAGTLRKYMTFAKHQQSETKEIPHPTKTRSVTTFSSAPASLIHSERSNKISSERRVSLTERKALPDDIESEFENL